MFLNCLFLTVVPSKHASSHTIPQQSGRISFQWGLESSCWFLTPAVFYMWFYVSSAPLQSCCISHRDSQMEYLLTPNCTCSRMTHFSGSAQAGHTLLPKRASQHAHRPDWAHCPWRKDQQTREMVFLFIVCRAVQWPVLHAEAHTYKSLRNVILYEETHCTSILPTVPLQL